MSEREREIFVEWANDVMLIVLKSGRTDLREVTEAKLRAAEEVRDERLRKLSVPA